MNVLISASVGLYKDKDGGYVLQVISSETEEHYLFPITETQANTLSYDEDLEIEVFDQDQS